MGGFTPKLKTPIQGKELGQRFSEFQNIGKKAFHEKYTPKIRETRRRESLLSKKKSEENNTSEINKKTLLGG